MRAEITIWHEDVRWGFATTPERKKIFVHEAAFRDRRQVSKVRVGTKILFDLPVAQTADQAFLDKLNSGKYRDDPAIALNHRKPGRALVNNEKPKAINVLVVEEIQK